jgi:acyl-CoA dehydrogenase
VSAIAWELPEDVRAVRDGLLDFARKEILPRHQAHRDLFEDPRRLYREDGRFSDALKALIDDVRRVSAKAGYYNMCVPESLGGGGLGHLAYYVGWEALFRLCGPQNWLMLYVISHWAFGPSRLLEKVTDEARERMLVADDGGRGVDVLRPVRTGAGSDAAALATRARARRQWLAPHGPQDLDLQRAGRGLLHRLCDHRSGTGGPAPRRHQRLPGAHQLAGLRGPARDQAFRPHRRR